MKYSNANKPLTCLMTRSTCYKGTYIFNPKGILWHCTGANNPNIWRYVQPTDDNPNKDALLSKIGKNKYGSDWNHSYVEAGVNAWIGKLADGTVTTVQALPWNYAPWGCASGPKGSANGSHIQFEMCEDALTDKNYFEACYKEGVELTAYLCKMYGIDPKGTTRVGSATVPTILCHYDAYQYGVGSGHYDVYNWFNKFGKTMDDVRNDVAALLKGTGPSPAPTPAPQPEPEELYRVRKSWNDAKSQVGAFKVLENAKNACPEGFTVFNKKGEAVYTKKKEEAKPTPSVPFVIRVRATDLNIRSGPGIQNESRGVIPVGVYTIVETQNGWGRLKSGAGWISLDYVVIL